MVSVMDKTKISCGSIMSIWEDFTDYVTVRKDNAAGLIGWSLSSSREMCEQV